MGKSYFEIIEKFIDNDLDADKLEWFQNKLREEPEFARQYQLQLDLNKAILEDDVMQLRDQLQDIYGQYMTNEKKTIRHNFIKRFSVAATIMLIIGLSLVYLLMEKTATTRELFTQYYKPYENITKMRSGDVGEDQGFNLAFKFYDKGLYNEALEQFNRLIESEPDNAFLLFYTAITEIETGNVEQAISKFKKIIELGNDIFSQQSEWYMGLCYLKLDNKEEAVRIFSRIVKAGSYYSPKAKKIISSLD